jgi:hypothetical protein
VELVEVEDPTTETWALVSLTNEKSSAIRYTSPASTWRCFVTKLCLIALRRLIKSLFVPRGDAT